MEARRQRQCLYGGAAVSLFNSDEEIPTAVSKRVDKLQSTRRESSVSNTLRWLGHSAWEIVTSQGKRILIDAWLSENPVAAVTIDELGKCDYALITHDHADHAGDTVEIARSTGAVVVGQPEVVDRYTQQANSQGHSIEAIGMNIGGTVDLGGVKVTMTDAYHSSESGMPAGYILTLEDGKVVYHMGDTGLHVNMSTWGELFDIDVVLIPIGDHFTMGAQQAAHALKWLKPKVALPMHYKTFPLLVQSADEFIEQAKAIAPDVEVRALELGERYAL